jgi:excisionase family DNA binding protein
MDLLTPREAADLLGVTTNTVARWARAGMIHALRLPGGSRRYSRAELTACMLAHSDGPALHPAAAVPAADTEGRTRDG